MFDSRIFDKKKKTSQLNHVDNKEEQVVYTYMLAPNPGSHFAIVRCQIVGKSFVKTSISPKIYVKLESLRVKSVEIMVLQVLQSSMKELSMG